MYQQDSEKRQQLFSDSPCYNLKLFSLHSPASLVTHELFSCSSISRVNSKGTASELTKSVLAGIGLNNTHNSQRHRVLTCEPSMMRQVMWRILNKGLSLCLISMLPQVFFGLECRHHNKRTANSSGTAHHRAGTGLPPLTIFRPRLYFFLKALSCLREGSSGPSSQGDGRESWCKVEGAQQGFCAAEQVAPRTHG